MQHYDFLKTPVNKTTVLNDSMFDEKYNETDGVLYTDNDETVVIEPIGNMMDSSAIITIIL